MSPAKGHATEAPSVPLAGQFDTPGQQQAAVTLGMWVFLGTELMLFGPLFLGFYYGRSHFPAGFAAASRHTDALLGTVNTAVLMTSSLLMALAVAARKAAATKLAARLLLGAALCGLAFLAIKGFEYHREWQDHLFPAAGAGFAFPDAAEARAARLFYVLYFAMTALHALHLTLGIVLVSLFAIALERDAFRFAAADRIEVAALYWHFVDIVWLFLYPLLYLTGRSAA